jgi:beta-N-acetylhexosaminidase
VSLDPERAAAACLFPSFHGIRAPDWIRSWLERGIGGVVLFARNVDSRGQLSALTGELRAERPDVLVAIDEEGGDVTRLEADTGSSYPGNSALGAVDDVELTERVAAAMGSDLAAVGVNVDLAPVADVNSNRENPIIGVRSFGSDPALVARHVAAFVVGLQGVGVAACAKHFPGHGDTEVDSHLELPVVAADRDTLEQRELPPFRAAVEAGVRSIMTAHISLPAIDSAPATLSRAVLQGLLREELGFAGVVITDALEMRGVSASVGVEEGAVRAIEAGADALCLGGDLGDDETSAVHGAIVGALRSGRLAEGRLAEAAGRVAELASWGSHQRPRRAEDSEVGMTAARRALEADGPAAITRPALVVELRPPASIAAGEAKHGLGEAIRDRAPSTEVVTLREAPDDPAALARSSDGQLVVVLRDAHRHAWQRETTEALVAAADGAIVVETGLPLWRPGGSTPYLATHGTGRVNFQAAAERLTG